MSKRKTSSSGGIGIGGAVFLVFLVLKLAGIGAVASWSWWWVTSPLWIMFALVVIFILGAVGVAAIADIKHRRRAKRGR